MSYLDYRRRGILVFKNDHGISLGSRHPARARYYMYVEYVEYVCKQGVANLIGC